MMSRSWWRTQRTKMDTPLEPRREPTPADLADQLRVAVRECGVAFQRRDQLIRMAKGSLTQRAIAGATDLSVPRIKQIQQRTSHRRHTSASALPPVTEVDVPGDQLAADIRPERELTLAEAAPWLEPAADSERAFLAARPSDGGAYDVHHDISDDGTDRWVVAMTTAAPHEVYAFLAEGGAKVAADPVDDSPGAGSTSGPLYVLGRVPNQALVEVALNPQTERIAGRPGGLAWVYGRVQLLTRVLAVIANPSSRLGPSELQEFVSSLPEEMRP